MVLTVEEIRNKIKSPNPEITQELDQAMRDDYKCAMHAMLQTDRNCIHYLPEFLVWVKRMIVEEKYQVFEHLLGLPIKTVEITQGILDELKKVFEAQDRFIDFEFDSPERKKSFDDLRIKIGELNYWHTKGFETMKAAPNSFVIIDLPEKQTGTMPEPYFYTIEPEDVIDTLPKLNGDLEFIIFRQNGFIYAFDDKNFRKLEDDTKKEATDQQFAVLSDVTHTLGYCPANTFWGTAMNIKSKIQKQNVILKSIAWLDSLLVSITMGEHLGWYAGFPIFIGYEHKCTYQDEIGNHCDGTGWIIGVDTYANTFRHACPQCAKNKTMLYAPGSVHSAPAPATSDEPDLINGINIVQPSTEGLEWIDKKIGSRISWLTYNLIGITDEVVSEAINEKQVVSQFESRQNVLIETRNNFERIQKWTDDTLARLMAGPAFKGSTVKYGDKFFLHSVPEMEKDYEEAITTGTAKYEIATRRHDLIQAKYRNNPRMKERQLILSWLEPFPDTMLADLAGVGISKDLIKLKAGFDYYVAKFEREFADVVSFMATTPLNTKMDLIKGHLLSYVKADSETEPDPTPTPAPPTPAI